jgi:hypothetical protein
MWLTPAPGCSAYAHLTMELALTLVSIASFFSLILAWTVLPASKAIASSSAPAPAGSPQVAL